MMSLGGKVERPPDHPPRSTRPAEPHSADTAATRPKTPTGKKARRLPYKPSSPAAASFDAAAYLSQYDQEVSTEKRHRHRAARLQEVASQGHKKAAACSVTGTASATAALAQPLLFQAGRGQVTRVRALIQAGAGVETVGPEGTTAFMEACSCAQGQEVAHYLLGLGCDTTRRDVHGRTGWDRAVHEGCPEVFRVLEAAAKRGHVELEAEWPRQEGRRLEMQAACLVQAAARGDTAEVERILQHPHLPLTPSVDAFRGGDTAYMAACRAGHASTVRALIAKGADTARINPAGQTGWSLAQRNQCLGVIETLAGAAAAGHVLLQDEAAAPRRCLTRRIAGRKPTRAIPAPSYRSTHGAGGRFV